MAHPKLQEWVTLAIAEASSVASWILGRSEELTVQVTGLGMQDGFQHHFGNKATVEVMFTFYVYIKGNIGQPVEIKVVFQLYSGDEYRIVKRVVSTNDGAWVREEFINVLAIDPKHRIYNVIETGKNPFRID